jgi:transcription initiation factor IIF auxiliary subunit
VSKKGTQAGKKNNTQVPQVQEKQTETTQGTTSSATQQEQGQTKRPVIQMGGVCKKSKVHRMPPEYTITEDDADLVAQMVQDHTVEDFDNAQCQRDRIEEELAYMRQLLQQLKETQGVDKA